MRTLNAGYKYIKIHLSFSSGSINIDWEIIYPPTRIRRWSVLPTEIELNNNNIQFIQIRKILNNFTYNLVPQWFYICKNYLAKFEIYGLSTRKLSEISHKIRKYI